MFFVSFQMRVYVLALASTEESNQIFISNVSVVVFFISG